MKFDIRVDRDVTVSMILGLGSDGGGKYEKVVCVNAVRLKAGHAKRIESKKGEPELRGVEIFVASNLPPLKNEN